MSHRLTRQSCCEHYARQAKDVELIDMATEVRKRAEIRAGELLAEIDLNKGGGIAGLITGRMVLPVMIQRQPISA